jgi:hypothetical protein
MGSVFVLGILKTEEGERLRGEGIGGFQERVI